MKRALAVLLALASCSGGNAALQPGPGSGREYRVLFIGNSLTDFNDLPGTVAHLAASTDDTISVQSVAKPNFALIDHVNGLSNAVEVVRSGDWDYVVLQQGPSALPESRDTLVLATRLLDPEIRAAGGRSALLMVWPESSRIGAWRAAWANDPDLRLYGGDGYHPSPLGTYAAALVVYEGITGHDARELPGEAIVAGQRLSVPGTTVRLLQRAAHETVVRFSPQQQESRKYEMHEITK